MLMSLLNYPLFFLSGILLNMSLVHLVNFAETRRHPMIAKSKTPKLTSTLWGLGQLFFGGLILLLLNYQFALSLETAFIFLGFSVWAIFLAIIAEKADERA
jgi:hypothetical protein